MDALESAITAVEGVGNLARRIGLGQSAVSNWRARGGLVPIEHCAAIESATAGSVRRWHLRPNDWHRIWPELVGMEGAPEIPQQKAA